MSHDTVDSDRSTAEGGRGLPSLKLIALLLVVAALAVFVYQNDEEAQVEFLSIDVAWPVSIVIGISVIAGVVLDRLASFAWRRAARRRARARS